MSAPTPTPPPPPPASPPPAREPAGSAPPRPSAGAVAAAPTGGGTPSLALAVYLGGALLLLALYTGVARWYTGVAWSLPLDDPFIYLQYARQAAAGHLFQYNSGDPVTSGCTSPIFALLLVPGFWLGLDGLAMVPVLLLIGAAALGASAWLAHRLAARWLGGGWGAWAGALVLFSGPVVWGAFSGMEIPLVSLLLLWLLERADRVLAGGAAPRALLVPATLTALIRPEGWLLVALLGALLAMRRWPAPASAPASRPLRALRRSLGTVLVPPLLAGLLPPFLFWLAGAGWVPAGVAAKSLWGAPGREWPEIARQVLVTAIEILKGIFGGSLGPRTSTHLVAYDMNARAEFFAPLTLALFLAGLAPAMAAEWRRRAPARATWMVAWFALLVLATATLVEPDAHFNRYQMPVMPLFLLGALAGAVRIGRWTQRAAGGAAAAGVAPGLAGFLLAFGIVSTAVFAVHYGDNAGDIVHLQMTMARVIDDRLPADAVVAVNDAGVLRYLTQRRTLDLVGLTSPGLARIWREGSGSLVEYLERLAPAARPTHFAIFPNWFRLGETGLLRRVHAVSLQAPSIVDAEKVLYAADWSRLAPAPGPCAAGVVPAGHRIVDQIDVAALDDEAQHAFRGWQRERGAPLPTVALAARCAGAGADSASAFADGGRVLFGGAAMQVRVEPGREAAIILRSRGGVRQRLVVSWNGAPVAAPDYRGSEGVWDERVVARVPAGLVSGRQARLELRPATADGARRPLLCFHVWITQP